jgi:predicted nucleic acid-binding protein
VAVAGWVLDKSAAARADDVIVGAQLAELAESLHVCPMGQLEQLYSARSGPEYDILRQRLHDGFKLITPPLDIFERALRLQRDLAHRHGLRHRVPIPDLLIAETALFHDLGVVHVDGDFERIAQVRPLLLLRLG